MFKKVLFYILLSYSGIKLNAQSFSGYLFDNENLPIAYASILNMRNENFTFSNKNGVFEIVAKRMDTLEIRHISFYSKKYIVTSFNRDTIFLAEKNLLLEEIIVASKTNTFTIGDNIKKKNILGLAINKEYAYLFSNPLDKSIKLKKIIIPVRFKKGYSNKGVFQFQFFKQDISNMISDVPMSQSYEIPINKIRKEIVIEFEENIIVTNKTDFFLVMKRAISEEIFNPKNPKNLSVNPFIFFEESHNNIDSIFFDKPISLGRWLEMTKYRFGTIPKFCIKIESIIIEE